MAKINTEGFKSILEKAGHGMVKAGKAMLELLKNRDFQMGVAITAIPVAIEIKHLKKQAKEKEQLLTEALRKHDAIIKELNKESEIEKDKRENLLKQDTLLKKEIHKQQSEIQGLKDKIIELEKKKAGDE